MQKMKMQRGGKKKMIKRADGSYSQRGLWDNIRANRGSGNEPTKEMLRQEKKIKAQEKMYGGKKKKMGGMKNKLRKKQGGGFMDKARNMAMRGDEAVRNLPGTISKGMSSMASKARSFFGFQKGGFPDLSGDGKITKKDILMGRGVIGKKKKQLGGKKVDFGDGVTAKYNRKGKMKKMKAVYEEDGKKIKEVTKFDKDLNEKKTKRKVTRKKMGGKKKMMGGKKKMMGGKKNMYQTGGFLEPGIENIDNL